MDFVQRYCMIEMCQLSCSQGIPLFEMFHSEKEMSNGHPSDMNLMSNFIQIAY